MVIKAGPTSFLPWELAPSAACNWDLSYRLWERLETWQTGKSLLEVYPGMMVYVQLMWGDMSFREMKAGGLSRQLDGFCRGQPQ